jgi:PleD family two-component response regulator
MEPEAAPMAAPAVASPEPTPIPPAPVAAQEPEPEPAVHVDDRSLAIVRMKKRTRVVLLAMSEGPDRDALGQFLHEDGYGRIVFADTLTSLLEFVDRPGIHLIFVDDGVAELKGLGLASLLRHRLEDEMPPVILADTQVDADLVLGAQETGVAQILVKPYDLDSDFLRMVEAHLGIG